MEEVYDVRKPYSIIYVFKLILEKKACIRVIGINSFYNSYDLKFLRSYNFI